MRSFLSKGLIVILLLSSNFLMAAIGDEPGTTPEYEAAQKVVEDFCYAWINVDYDVMYSMLTDSAENKQSKEEFIDEYNKYRLVPSELIQYPEIPPFLAHEGRMIIRVEARPKKEPSVEEKNIVISFEISLINKDNEGWKVDDIHILIPMDIYL